MLTYAARFLTVMIAGAAILPLMSWGQEQAQADSILMYRTPQERRESGIKHFLTDWWSVAGLVELEYQTERYALSESSGHSYQDEDSGSIQIATELNPLSWAQTEFVYEYELDTNKHIVDEAIGVIEVDDFSLEFGKMEVPFGEYFSYFASGPIVEIGETKAKGLVLVYDVNNLAELSMFIYDGRREQAGSSNHSLDWGFALESSPVEWSTLGLSYISDLADSMEGFLSGYDLPHRRRTSGLSTYLTVTAYSFDFTFEYLGALSRFEELEAEINKPEAWNFEVAQLLTEDIIAALRFEGSGEVQDVPHLSAGLSVSWRISERVLIAVDCLRGWYKQGLTADSNDRDIDNRNIFLGQIRVVL